MTSKRESEMIQQELRSLRSRNLNVEGQIPLIKEAMAQVKDMLSGLIPESTYLKLRDLPEKDLPPSEWVLVNVWEIAYPFKKESELQKREIFRLREELKKSMDRHNAILGEMEHHSKLLNDKDEDYKRYQLNYENARRAIEQELSKKQEEVNGLREKGSGYDELLRNFKMLQQEKSLLEEKMGYYAKSSSEDGKSALTQIYQSTEEFRRKNELLQ